MTDADKVWEYDFIEGFLKKNGWTVVAEGPSPADDRLLRTWWHPDCGEGAYHNFFSAFTMECYWNAPKQGKKMTTTLKELNKVIDEKQKRQCRECGHEISQDRIGPWCSKACREADPRST
jgi:hypothetical protein